MKATLSPHWELSTEHTASSNGQPVLVHPSTGPPTAPGTSWGCIREMADCLQRTRCAGWEGRRGWTRMARRSSRGSSGGSRRGRTRALEVAGGEMVE
jgi:hypothetical protein